MTGLGVSQLFFGHVGAMLIFDVWLLPIFGLRRWLARCVRIDPERHLNLHISRGASGKLLKVRCQGLCCPKVTGLALADLDMNLFGLSALVENTGSVRSAGACCG